MRRRISHNPAFRRPAAPGQGYMGPPGRPLTDYEDVAPMPPSWASQGGLYQPITPPEEGAEFMPGDPSIFMADRHRVIRQPMPTAGRARIGDRDSPALYETFADYSNAISGREGPDVAAVDSEPWRQMAPELISERDAPLAIGEAAPRRGLEPPSASDLDDEEMAALSAAMDDQAFAEALERARQSIREEGYPYMEDRDWVAARTEQDIAVERHRRASNEQARREGVSWDEWWRFGGRQDDWTPNDGPAYRSGPAPRIGRR